MKILHTSDIHLGKRVNEFPMLEDQKYILDQIVRIVEKERPDVVLISGDVYNTSTPSAGSPEAQQPVRPHHTLPDPQHPRPLSDCR